MISLSFSAVAGQARAFGTTADQSKAFDQLMDRYKALPRHIARKHLGAAMRRVLKPAVPILRRNTPPLGTRRGRRKAGAAPSSTGSLRKAVTVRVGQTGNNKDFGSFVWGVVGFKAGPESRKAIWLEYGTSRGGPRYDMVGKTMREYGRPAADNLAAEMAKAFEKAVKEFASGKNPPRG